MKHLLRNILWIILALFIGYLLASSDISSLSNMDGFWIGFFTSFFILFAAILGHKNLKGGLKVLILVAGLMSLIIYLFFFLQSRSFEKQYEANKLELSVLRQEKVAEYEKLKNIQELELIMALSSLQLDSLRNLGSDDLLFLKKLSNEFEPISFPIEYDNSSLKLSPGRGKLLRMLLHSKLDSISLSMAIKSIDFTHSDLRSSELSNLNLSGINLEHSNLNKANLRFANLSKANLSFCNMKACDLRNSTLNESRFNESDLSWSLLSNSSGTAAIFDGANLDNTKIDSAKFVECSFRMASLKASILRNSNLYGSNLWAANLHNANLEAVDLRFGLLKDALLSHTNMKAMRFKSTAVVENWDSILESSASDGSSEILENYEIGLDTNPRFPIVKYYLNRK